MDIFAYNYLTGETISTDCRFVFNSQKFSGNWQNPLRIYISSTQTDETANPVKLSCSPNPFNPVTTINFSLSEAGEIKINIYNIKGQKVNALKTKNLEPGNHQLIWQGTDQQNRPCASGVYFFLLKAGAKTETCRALLLK
jgi:hypothetical protein